MLNELSLFSGYGGFNLGLRLAGLKVRTIAYVEIENYCQEIIKARIQDGFLDDAPIFGDIRLALSTGQLRQFRGLVDIVTGGFPCQPHSHAGQRKGADDSRNLWPETLECVRQVAPSYVLLENVPGILSNEYAGTVIGQLAGIGYDCIWDCVPAAACGAPHLRWRWWALAYTTSQRDRFIQASKGLAWDELHCFGRQRVGHQPNNSDTIMADAQQSRCKKRIGGQEHVWGELETGCGGSNSWWATEPDVGRVADGITHRVDRLKALGNGIVPAVVARFLNGHI